MMMKSAICIVWHDVLIKHYIHIKFALLGFDIDILTNKMSRTSVLYKNTEYVFNINGFAIF